MTTSITFGSVSLAKSKIDFMYTLIAASLAGFELTILSNDNTICRLTICD